MPTNGITISVTAETNAGGRRHMEDYVAVCLSPNDALRDIPELREQAYVGVFDGHGGKEAAKYARENMWEVIQAQPQFRSTDVESVRQSISKAYQELHNDMLNYRASWKCNKTGDPSTAGTTACTVIFRKDHIFVANVGDTTAVMGVKNSRYGQLGEPPTLAKVLTIDHKPEDPMEQERVKSLGGKVMMSPKGVMRVVWERQKKASPSSGQNGVDLIPFLSVARSLGDFWSYNPRTQKFVVSPTPDVHVYPMDLTTQKFVVVASDGLWNVMTPQEVVDFIYEYENDVTDCSQPKDVVSAIIKEALERWDSKRLLADNISVLIAFLSEEEEGESSSVTSREPSRPAATYPAASNCTETSAMADRDKESKKPSPVPASVLPLSEPEVSSTLPSSPLPVPFALPPLSTCSSEPSLFHSIAHSKSGSLEFYREQQPCGITIQYQSKIRLRQRRKHRKNRTLAKRLVRHTMNLSNGKAASTTEQSRTLENGVTPPVGVRPSLQQEFSMFGSDNGPKFPEGCPLPAAEAESTLSPLGKRLHLSAPEDSIDEGLDLGPCEKLRRHSDQELKSMSSKDLILLRSQRHSTDAASDSGSSNSSSSGVYSDVEHPPDHHQDSCDSTSSMHKGLSQPASTAQLLDEQNGQVVKECLAVGEC